ATGAHLTSDNGWQQSQLTALANFEAQIPQILSFLPDRLAAWGQDLLVQGIDPRTLTLTDVIAARSNIAQHGLPSAMLTAANTFGADQTAISDIQRMLVKVAPTEALKVLQRVLDTGPLLSPQLAASSNLPQVAAVLPASRSVKVGNAATAF